jgi:hypothetical protein
MAAKTRVLSSPRAGLGSVVVTDPPSGTTKSQVISNVGVVTVVPSTPSGGTVPFVIHPFV